MVVNPESLKSTLPFLNLTFSTDTKRGFSLKSVTKWKGVYPEETVRTSRLIWI